MLKLPNCERTSLKSFIDILKTYGLDQQRESNMRVVENSRLETKVLTYQPEQGGHLRVAKEKLQELEVDQLYAKLPFFIITCFCFIIS